MMYKFMSASVNKIYYDVCKCLSSGAVVGDELPGSTVIGCNTIIGHHAVVGIRCQDLKYKELNAS